MNYKVALILGLVTLFSATSVQADLTGTKKIHLQIDKELAEIDLESLSLREKQDMLADPVRLNLNMLIPIYGSYVLDTKLYGDVRPPAIIFDWTLGGFIPLGLLFFTAAKGDSLSAKARKSMISTAIGLYLVTRIGVVITINEHIHQYNKYKSEQLGLDQEAPEHAALTLKFEKAF